MPKKNYIFGTNMNDTFNGTSADDVMTGYDGSDYFRGEAGNDTYYGGKGDDYFYVQDAGDVVIEKADEGKDKVYSYIKNYTLTDNVENLTLVGDAAENGTGNELDNVIKGNSNENILGGAAGDDTIDGGKGADFMIGGLGDDTFYVDNPGDLIWEISDQGIDKVISSITYKLDINLERLTLKSGAGAIDGTGNEKNNIIVGNESNNVLKGGDGWDSLNGMGGNDTMYGGARDDVYVVDSASDTIIEYANEGVQDVIYAQNTNYWMPDNVETMQMFGLDAIVGLGNNGYNRIVGSDADNILYGYGDLDYLWGEVGNDIINGGDGDDFIYGGEGTDTLTGGADNDTFQFRQAGGQEIITDFKANGDLDIMQVGVFNSFASVMNATQQVGNDTVITFDANTSMTLQNFNMNNLQTADFQFI